MRCLFQRVIEWGFINARDHLSQLAPDSQGNANINRQIQAIASFVMNLTPKCLNSGGNWTQSIAIPKDTARAHRDS